MTALVITLTLSLGFSFAYGVKENRYHLARQMRLDSGDNINVYNFETLTGQGINDCIESCKAKKLCKFINFDRLAKLCFLIGVRDDTLSMDDYIVDMVEVKPGIYFGAKEEWNMEEDPCVGCKKFGVCSNSNCLNSGCEPPVNKENALLLGNMFSVGNKIRYTCKEGYKSNETVPLTSTCLENGTWSSVEVKCLPEAVFGNDIYKFNNTFYKLVKKEQVWESANVTCDSMDLHLVDIKTSEEQLFIAEKFVDVNVCFWTGGRRRGDWFVWLDGTNVPVNTDYWADSQPDFYNNSQDCVILEVADGYKLNDKECDHSCYVICVHAQ